MSWKVFSLTGRVSAVLAILIAGAPAPAKEGGLIHGLSIRDASKPQQPAEIEGDLFYLRQAVPETSFAADLKLRLDKLIVGARDEVRPITRSAGDNPSPKLSDEALQIRRRLDWAVEAMLTPGQIDELNRRTAVLCLEEIVLADGGHDFFGDADAVGIKLTPVQKEKLGHLLEDADKKIADAGKDRATWRLQLEIIQATRQDVLHMLTAEQSRAWDDWCQRVLALTPPPPSTQAAPAEKK